MKRLLVLAVAVGCGDPGFICEETGEHIKYNGTCAPARPTITVDGDFSDWTSLKLPANSCAPECGPGEVTDVVTIVTGNGEVAAFAKVTGALDDSVHAYVFSFEPIDGPPFDLDVRLRSTTVETFLSTTGITGFPARAAMGADGIEVAVPIAALPFTAATYVTARLDVYDAGTSSWEFGQQTFVHLVPACWDPSSPFCRPKQHL